jgi:hypothetical protein
MPHVAVRQLTQLCMAAPAGQQQCFHKPLAVATTRAQTTALFLPTAQMLSIHTHSQHACTCWQQHAPQGFEVAMRAQLPSLHHSGEET